MKYCPKCGSLMLPQRRNDKTVLRCQRCGYESLADNKEAYKVKRTVQRKPDDVILVIDSNVKVEVLPKTKIECPRCRSEEAYYWEMQTRAGDEPATRFFKCVKCGYVWREYQ
ncbi:MAG: transcription factor S [Thermofilaceae archaeon]